MTCTFFFCRNNIMMLAICYPVDVWSQWFPKYTIMSMEFMINIFKRWFVQLMVGDDFRGSTVYASCRHRRRDKDCLLNRSRLSTPNHSTQYLYTKYVVITNANTILGSTTLVKTFFPALCSILQSQYLQVMRAQTSVNAVAAVVQAQFY